MSDRRAHAAVVAVSLGVAAGAAWLTYTMLSPFAWNWRLLWATVAGAAMLVPMAFHFALSRRPDHGLPCRNCGYERPGRIAVGFCTACGMPPEGKRTEQVSPR